MPREGRTFQFDARTGWGGSAVYYMQLAVPNVVAMAVRMVITMLRILPQMVLLFNVPIVISLRLKVNVAKPRLIATMSQVKGLEVRGERMRGVDPPPCPSL